MNFIKNHT